MAVHGFGQAHYEPRSGLALAVVEQLILNSRVRLIGPPTERNGVQVEALDKIMSRAWTGEVRSIVKAAVKLG